MSCDRLTLHQAVRNLRAGLVAMSVLVALSGCGSQSEKPVDKPASSDAPVLVGTVIPATPPQPGAVDGLDPESTKPVAEVAMPPAPPQPRAETNSAPAKPVAAAHRPALASKKSANARRRFACSQRAVSTALSPDDTTVAVARDDGHILLFDAATSQLTADFPANPAAAVLAFSPDGKSLASGSLTDGQVKLWDVAGRRELAALGRVGGTVTEIAFSKDGQTVAATGMISYQPDMQGTLRTWDVTTHRAGQTRAPHRGAVWSVVFSRHGKWMATCGVAGRTQEGETQGEVKIWGPDGAELLHTISNVLGR